MKENFKQLPGVAIKEGEDGSESVKIVITKNSIFDDYRLFYFKTSSGESLASLVWMGTSIADGKTIFQPAIVANVPGETTCLSYDGRANYVGGSGSDLITMPSDGKKYSISTPKPHYFNNDDPLVFDPTYNLNSNNESIEMRNISIFKGDYSQGVMVELRASMEGSTSGNSDDGFVVIMLKVVQIN